MCLTGAESYTKKGRDKNSYKVKEMRHSIHSYMLIAVNRYVDQFHMWILQNFVIEFKHNFYRKLDQEYSPNSGTMSGDEVKARMEEKPSDVKKRTDAHTAIRKLNQSLTEIDTVNRS